MTIKIKQATWTVKDAALTEENISLKSTTHYEKFRIDPVNRPVDEKHVDELARAIVKKNLLREYPIVVSTDYTVIDGQHRLMAAQRLKVPIYFIVSSDATIEAVADTNRLQAPWKTESFMHHWSMQGNEHYLMLHRFHESFPFLSMSVCRDLLWGEGGKSSPAESFKHGEFVVTRPDYAERVANALLDFKRFTTLWTHGAFVRTVMNLVANPQYDHKRMMMKLEYLSARLVKCADIKGYMLVINQIYNYKVRPADVVELKQVLAKQRRYHRKQDETKEAKSNETEA